MAHADEARKPHGPAVDERDAEAPAEDPEDGVARGHAEVAPERQLQPSRHRVPLDRRDDRLRERKARRAHRAVTVGLEPVPPSRPEGFQVGPRAERSAGPRQDRHGGRLLPLEPPERLGQLGGRRAVDGVLRFRPVDRDDRDRPLDLVADAHARILAAQIFVSRPGETS